MTSFVPLANGVTECICIVTVTVMSGVRTVPFARLMRLGVTINTFMDLIFGFNFPKL